jgi:hypothetical protein
MKALYFQHDYSARNDERLLDIRAEWGWEGYGLYFGLIEMMAENNGHLNSTKLGAVALGLAVELPKLKSFISDLLSTGLLYDEAGLLRSRRLDKHFEYREQCAEAGRRGGKASGRWQDKSADESAPLKPTISHPDTAPEAEPSAIKNSIEQNSIEQKEKKGYVAMRPPSEQDVALYFNQIGSTEIEAATFYDHFTANGWKVGGKAPMKDWRAASRNWVRNSKTKYNNGSNTDKREQRIDRVAKFGR